MYGYSANKHWHQHRQWHNRHWAGDYSRYHTLECANGQVYKTSGHRFVFGATRVSRLHKIPQLADKDSVPIILFVQTTYMRNDDVVDETWSLVKPIILGQIALNASIITACVPSLKGVIDTFWSGATVFTAPAHYTTHNSQRSGLVYGVRSRFTKTQNTSQTPPAKSKSRDRSGDRSESQEDLHRSVIHRTVEYQVEYEREEMPRRSRTKK